MATLGLEEHMRTPVATLDIQLASGFARRPSASANRVSGGPEVLLSWLETQLGLGRQSLARAERILEYAKALGSIEGSAYEKSLSTDNWGTASELLARRDELRLAGWDEMVNPKVPSLVCDLARAAEGRSFLPDAKHRIDTILAALASGQTLPPHECALRDAYSYWPAAWRPLLSRLNVIEPVPVAPAAPPSTALGGAQRLLLEGMAGQVRIDGTLRWFRARSVQTACEAVATALAQEPSLAAETVVLCEDNTTAACMDSCLAAVGIPTMGARTSSLSHPALQVLPLTLQLSWEPVDVQTLMDFLALPVKPIPERVTRPLLNALSEEPGLGGPKWQATVARLTSPEEDRDARNGDCIEKWLGGPRVQLGESLPTDMAAAICARVANWAGARAATLESGEEPASGSLALALSMAAGQAALVRRLVLGLSQPLSEPQLSRLLEEAQEDTVATPVRQEAAGGPVRIRSLAEIGDSCPRLIWLGLAAEDLRLCHWTSSELAALREGGLEVDEGAIRLQVLRDAERRGFALIRDSLLAVELPGNEEDRSHPLWLQVRGAIGDGEGAGEVRPIPLDDLFCAEAAGLAEPYTLPPSTFQVVPAQPHRTLWDCSASGDMHRETTSASDLQDRLGCPFKWVLKYVAKIRPGAVASLPDIFTLKGSFCHSVLKAVLESTEELPTADQVRRLVVEQFDSQVALEAAPLAQPSRAGEALEARTNLAAAAARLVEVLSAGQYRIVGMEFDAGGNVNGVPLSTFIDCLAKTADGYEAVVDFKYGGRKKYPAMLEDGRALQLAVYAHARSQACEGSCPAVAYLILSSAAVFTPEGSRILGDGPVSVIAGAAPMSEVFAGFMVALDAADAWMSGDAPLPARPLQPQEDRPPGSEMAIGRPDRGYTQADVDPCKYCDYKALCGMEVLA